MKTSRHPPAPGETSAEPGGLAALVNAPSRRDADIVPALAPRLPTADRLLPYLQMIDEARVYANFGPLARLFGRRLSAMFGLAETGVVVAGSGTSALIGAILAHAGRAQDGRMTAILPAFTFVGTAAAVEACGYRIRLADIGENLLLDPEALGSLGDVGLIAPVGAFGRAVPLRMWREVQERSGVPVVIDGAACFEAAAAAPDATLGDIPVAMSFHATKSLAAGEGGCVVTSDVALAERVVRALNFGFLGSRECRSASINGKLSEYHAAVGLAELDFWEEKRAALGAVAAAYRQGFAALGLAGRFLGAPDIALCYALFDCGSAASARRIVASLTSDKIESRFWYGDGLAAHPYYRDLQHDGLRRTKEIAPRLLGLPVAPDLTPAVVARVVRTVGDALASKSLGDAGV